MYSLQRLINNQNSQLIYYTIRSLSTLANSQGKLQKVLETIKFSIVYTWKTI